MCAVVIYLTPVNGFYKKYLYFSGVNVESILADAENLRFTSEYFNGSTQTKAAVYKIGVVSNEGE